MLLLFLNLQAWEDIWVKEYNSNIPSSDISLKLAHKSAVSFSYSSIIVKMHRLFCFLPTPFVIVVIVIIRRCLEFVKFRGGEIKAHFSSPANIFKRQTIRHMQQATTNQSRTDLVLCLPPIRRRRRLCALFLPSPFFPFVSSSKFHRVHCCIHTTHNRN